MCILEKPRVYNKKPHEPHAQLPRAPDARGPSLRTAASSRSHQNGLSASPCVRALELGEAAAAASSRRPCEEPEHFHEPTHPGLLLASEF